MAPAVQVGLLGHLLGLGAVTQDADGEAERPRRGGVVPLGEGCFVATPGAPEQVGQVRSDRPALLRGRVGRHRPEVAHVPILALLHAAVSVCSCPVTRGIRRGRRSGLGRTVLAGCRACRSWSTTPSLSPSRRSPSTPPPTATRSPSSW